MKYAYMQMELIITGTNKIWFDTKMLPEPVGKKLLSRSCSRWK